MDNQQREQSRQPDDAVDRRTESERNRLTPPRQARFKVLPRAVPLSAFVCGLCPYKVLLGVKRCERCRHI